MRHRTSQHGGHRHVTEPRPVSIEMDEKLPKSKAGQIRLAFRANSNHLPSGFVDATPA